jgi:hypothetical protein
MLHTLSLDDLVEYMRTVYANRHKLDDETWYGDLDAAMQELARRFDYHGLQPLVCPNWHAGIHCDCWWCQKHPAQKCNARIGSRVCNKPRGHWRNK